MKPSVGFYRLFALCWVLYASAKAIGGNEMRLVVYLIFSFIAWVGVVLMGGFDDKPK